MKQHDGCLLQMQDICKSFSGVQVLNDVQFDLYPGEVHILAGENGAGKSTLIKILSGVHTDYSGSIRIGSKSVAFSSIHEAVSAGISVIHQELSLVPTMNIAENIFLGREKSRCQWLDKKAMNRAACEFLDRIGLHIDVTRKVEECPLATRQMIEICKATAFDCKILVMDEPTSALTDVEVENLFTIIEKLRQTGCGIIYITHKMEEIYRIADRITVLRDGQYIGTAGASDLNQSKLIQWMVGRQLSQQDLRHQTRKDSTALTVEAFSVPGPSAKSNPLVSNVSFTVKHGEILGIAGLQDSGKSELLNGLFGTYGTNTRGTIELDGKPYTPSTPSRAIAAGLSLLTNDRKTTGLVLGMNIIHNITLTALKHYSSAGWMRPSKECEAAEKHRRQLNLKTANLSMSVDSLSGGNQQKVALAKWIETNPGVLFLDEPTRGVDIAAKCEIYELMNEWTAGGIAIVLITSEMSELLAMSDRIMVMHRGRVTAEFTASQASQEKILRAAMG